MKAECSSASSGATGSDGAGNTSHLKAVWCHSEHAGYWGQFTKLYLFVFLTSVLIFCFNYLKGLRSEVFNKSHAMYLKSCKWSLQRKSAINQTTQTYWCIKRCVHASCFHAYSCTVIITRQDINVQQMKSWDIQQEMCWTLHTTLTHIALVSSRHRTIHVYGWFTSRCKWLWLWLTAPPYKESTSYR